MDEFKTELAEYRRLGASADLLLMLWEWGPECGFMSALRGSDDLPGLLAILNDSVEAVQARRLQEAAE